MRLYCGFDLHASNSYVGVIDEEGKRVYQRKLPNERQEILSALSVYQDQVDGVAIESTYNWYWLVDLLMEEGFGVHLANPAAIQKYKGLKHSDDVSDAFWLA